MGLSSCPHHPIPYTRALTIRDPKFFEFIQHKGDDGFGGGNFKAFLESIEADQIEYGIFTEDDSLEQSAY